MVVGVLVEVVVAVIAVVLVIDVAVTVAVAARASSGSVSACVCGVGSATVRVCVSGRAVCSSSGEKVSSSGAVRSRTRKSSGWGDESVIASEGDQSMVCCQ